MPLLASVVQIRRNKRAAGTWSHGLAAGWPGLGTLLQTRLPGEELARFFVSVD
jgi:hypothetical protein